MVHLGHLIEHSVIPASLQDVTTNTNTIEAYNGFAKWLSFGGDVVAANDPHEQQKRLRYNHLILIAACVIVQNTVNMTRALEQVEAQS